MAALYEYSPFGELLRCEEPSSGGFAKANPIRFSTKYQDTETGLIYYGARYYSASLGRFINRDPIEEQGGLNLYGFCGNDAIDHWDVLGHENGSVSTAERAQSDNWANYPLLWVLSEHRIPHKPYGDKLDLSLFGTIDLIGPSPAVNKNITQNNQSDGDDYSGQNSSSKAPSRLVQWLIKKDILARTNNPTPEQKKMAEAIILGRAEGAMDAGRHDLASKYMIQLWKLSSVSTAQYQLGHAATLALDFGLGEFGAPEAGLRKFSVGIYDEIRGQVPGLDAHHVGQKAIMEKLIPGYDAATAPSILVPKVGHTIRGPNGILSRNTEGFNSARDVIARDIRELRRVYPDVPNSKLQELIKMNKDLFPSLRKRPQ